MSDEEDERKPLEAIKWKDGELHILDQTALPWKTRFIAVPNVKAGWEVINKMQVRGAPAIAIVGCLSLAAELWEKDFTDKDCLRREIEEKLRYLVSARPTAVNMKRAADSLITLANDLTERKIKLPEMKYELMTAIIDMMRDDVSDNTRIGDFGAETITNKIPSDSITILTHCNTGSLATAGYGTALGVIRSLHMQKKLERVYFTETRPYLQGARLTAYELMYDKIPATLICDNMVAALFKTKQISAVVVGADRVAANGDTANKIGTYQIAILAKYHSVPFYVAAPQTSIDFSLPDGDRITIEERPNREITHINDQAIALPGVHCWNPAFDVTPANLITGIITERGTYEPAHLTELDQIMRKLRLERERNVK